MTDANTNAPLKGIELLVAFFELANNYEGAANELPPLEDLAQVAGWETTKEALAEMRTELQQAHQEFLAFQEKETFQDDCLATFHKDAQTFAAVAYAPVKMTFMKWFGTPFGVLELDEAQEVWVNTYKRLAQTEWGIQLINQTRTLVATWFARWGNPEAGTFDERTPLLLAEWDAWEKEAGGIPDENGAITNDCVDKIVPHTTDYNQKFGTYLAIVMATDAYYAENKGNAEALKVWPKEGTTYDKDVAYVAEQLTFLHKGNIPAQFDVVMEAFIPLINHTHRFKNIGGMWAVQRLQELLEVHPEGVPAVGRW
jgi:hypothetical protein